MTGERGLVVCEVCESALGALRAAGTCGTFDVLKRTWQAIPPMCHVVLPHKFYLSAVKYQNNTNKDDLFK